MVKCLITKLEGIVNNSNLLKIGEMRLRIAKSETSVSTGKKIDFNVSKPVTIEIIGNGYFTDSNLTDNKGKTFTLNTGEQSIFVSNDVEDIAILDKYSIIKLSSNYGKTISLDISALKYSKYLTEIYLPNTQINGNIGDLKNLTALNKLYLSNTQIYGNVGDLKNLTSLSYLYLYNTQVTGNIGDLKNLTALSDINMSNTQVTGNVGDLKSLTALKVLNLLNTQVTGNIGDLKSLTTLTVLSAGNNKTPLTGDIGTLSTLIKCTEISLQSAKLTGDLAAIPASCRFISFKGDKGSTLTWGTRPSSSKIIAIEGKASLTNIDKMLQNQAQCQVGFTAGEGAWYKIISVAGNRTSASDDAVVTLQQKGYTVSIDKA